MARNIDVVDASLKTWYVPDIEDNRDDPDPFKVLISPLNGKEMRQLRSSLKLSATSLESDDLMQAAERREEELKTLVISQHVHEVVGYFARHVGTGEVIEPKTGDALVGCILDAHPNELVVLNDIHEAILRSSTLSEEMKKKQSLQSGLRFQETPEDKAGGVQSVGGLTLQSRTISEDSAIVTAVPASRVSAVSGSLD